MKDLVSSLRTSVISVLVFTALCGIAYPLLMLGISALAFPEQATGSLIRSTSGGVVGSRLIGQPFDDPAYLWSRPTAAANVGPSGFVDQQGHLGPNPALVDAVTARMKALRDADPDNTARVPVDLVTTSGSGLDPHISPAAAYYQVGRIARARGLSAAQVREIVERHVEPRTLLVLGEPRVNVLTVNLALDARFGPPRR